MTTAAVPGKDQPPSTRSDELDIERGCHMVTESTRRGAPRRLHMPPSTIVSDDVLHVLRCGRAEAAVAALDEWSEVSDDPDMNAYLAPPLGCNCGRVGDRPALEVDPSPPPLRSAGPPPTKVDVRRVYFIHAPSANLIKIGVSGNVESRRRELERNAPGEDRLILLATEPGGLSRERELHARFADERQRGEWFAASRRLLTYVASVPA